jgi:magnesium transporter
MHEFRREIANSALLGLGCGSLVALIVLGWQGITMAAPVIGLSIFLSIVSASLIGLSVPSILHALKLNPTVAAGSVTLALTDISTLFLYFGTASILL